MMSLTIFLLAQQAVEDHRGDRIHIFSKLTLTFHQIFDVKEASYCVDLVNINAQVIEDDCM